MAELPIHPARGREAPGYSLSLRLERSRGLSVDLREEAHHRLRVECAYETLRLTGAPTDRAVVTRLGEERRRGGAGAEGAALVLGQLEALEILERGAVEGRELDLELTREVHRHANPPSEGELRTEDLAPQFRNVRPSAARFVPDRLQNLLDWLSAESGRKMFPAEKMALWFPRFVEISPFPSGNFRTAHLFLSFFSRSSGYPPVFLLRDEADDIRSEVERALRFDTFPLVQRFSQSLGRSLAFLESLSEERR